MKRLTKALRYAAAAAVCVLAATTAVDAAVAKQVRLVQVLHRHGARASVVSYNGTEICTEAPCGYLTSAGLTMLQNVGAFLRTRYNTDATVVDAPFFPSEAYDLDVAYSRSTDVLRTLQSAEAFLRGFFPKLDALFPAIHTQREEYDRLLNSNFQPWLKFFYGNNKPLLRAAGNPTTDEMFPDWTELTKIGATVYSDGRCSIYEQRSDCARNLFDIAAAKKAMGLLDEFPQLRDNYDKLRAVTHSVFDYEYHFNKSYELHFRQGGRGQPFVEEMMDNMDDVIKGKNRFHLMHYSAHDTTLAPVWGTLGDRTEYGMLPLFAQALVAELLQDTADQSYHVRVLRGHPGQSPDTNFAFVWDDTWQLRCINSAGAMYEAQDNTCPLDDFRRLTEWSKPGDVQGLCYLDEDFVAIRNCTNATVGVGESGPTLTDTCIYYREHCPEFSCGNGCALNGVSLQCVCALHDGPDANNKTAPPVMITQHFGVSDGAVAGIAIATFALGCLIAAALTVIVFLCRNQKGYETISDAPL